MYARASSPTSPSSVAEKSIVCRSRGRRADDPLDLRPEAHVEHPVGLVEDEDVDVVERDHLALDEILQPAGRRDDDVRALELLRLRADRSAAVGEADLDALRRGERLDLLGDLERELAGRHEHERRRGLAVGGRPLDERDAEGERLARARRRLREDVATREGVREDEGLDAERLGDAAGRERLLDGLAHAERAKRVQTCVVRLLDIAVRDQTLETAKGGTRS